MHTHINNHLVKLYDRAADKSHEQDEDLKHRV